MEDDEFLGCISCMSATDLYDLFAVYEENGVAYANMFETCFDIKVNFISFLKLFRSKRMVLKVENSKKVF